MLDGGHAALGDAHPGSDLGLGDAEAAAHLGEPEGALLSAQLLDPSGDGGRQPWPNFQVQGMRLSTQRRICS